MYQKRWTKIITEKKTHQNLKTEKSSNGRTGRVNDFLLKRNSWYSYMAWLALRTSATLVASGLGRRQKELRLGRGFEHAQEKGDEIHATVPKSGLVPRRYAVGWPCPAQN